MDALAPDDRAVAFELALEVAILPAYRLVCGMLHDPQAAEDVVQEAAIKAWPKQHQLREGEPLLPWFLGIVANECRGHFRRRWTSVVKQATMVVEAPAVDLDAGADLRRELRRLHADDRMVGSPASVIVPVPDGSSPRYLQFSDANNGLFVPIPMESTWPTLMVTRDGGALGGRRPCPERRA